MNNNFNQQSNEFDENFPSTTSTLMDTFLSALRNKQLLGVKSANDEVIVPPIETDPTTGEKLNKLVHVGEHGSVVSWCWVRHPNDRKTFRSAYAWALIQLDGADTPIVHRVVTNNEKAMEVDMRVKIEWAEHTQGRISDIICFKPITK